MPDLISGGDNKSIVDAWCVGVEFFRPCNAGSSGSTPDELPKRGVRSVGDSTLTNAAPT